MNEPDESIDQRSCNHYYKRIDESFDHEFGTEQIIYYECAHCGKVTDNPPLED